MSNGCNFTLHQAKLIKVSYLFYVFVLMQTIFFINKEVQEKHGHTKLCSAWSASSMWNLQVFTGRINIFPWFEYKFQVNFSIHFICTFLNFTRTVKNLLEQWSDQMKVCLKYSKYTQTCPNIFKEIKVFTTKKYCKLKNLILHICRNLHTFQCKI